MQSSNATIVRTRFEYGQALSGGAVSSAVLSVQDSSFVGNSAAVSGGSLHIINTAGAPPGGVSAIVNSVFEKNAAAGLTAQGGACAAFFSTLSFLNCSFENNTATTISSGGGTLATISSGGRTLAAHPSQNGYNDFIISALGDATLITGVRSPVCSAPRVQPRVLHDHRSHRIIESQLFAENPCRPSRSQAGGAVYAFGNGSVTSIVASIMVGNSAELGGAVFVGGESSVNSSASVLASECTFLGNAGRDRGGAVAARNVSQLILRSSTFRLNVASRGGAVAAESLGTVVVDSVSAVTNAADLTGGVFLFSSLATLAMSSSTFADNSAAAGGVLFADDAAAVPPCLQASSLFGAGGGAPDASRCTLRNNTAGRYGDIVASKVIRVAVTASRSIQSGGVLTPSVTLYDGARDPKGTNALAATEWRLNPNPSELRFCLLESDCVPSISSVSPGYDQVVSGWPQLVTIHVATSNGSLEGETSTPYKGPGQGFSGLSLLGEANATVQVVFLALLPTVQSGRAVATVVPVEVQLCSMTEIFDPALSRCVCPPGSQRTAEGTCKCSGVHFHRFTLVDGAQRRLQRALPRRALGSAWQSTACLLARPLAHAGDLSTIICKPCKASSFACTDGFLAPSDGYWHSQPESQALQRCPAVEACTGRLHRLLDIQRQAAGAAAGNKSRSITQLILSGEFDLPGYRRQLCNPGYEGPLCARCEVCKAATAFPRRAHASKARSKWQQLMTVFVLRPSARVPSSDRLATAALGRTRTAAPAGRPRRWSGVALASWRYTLVYLGSLSSRAWHSPASRRCYNKRSAWARCDGFYLNASVRLTGSAGWMSPIISVLLAHCRYSKCS